MEVCPAQVEPMLDIRRHQVMIEGDFPAQLQTAFRGMERTSNPWGINRDKRLDWAEGLKVKTIEEKPQPDVLYWEGCAASYDPQSQKTKDVSELLFESVEKKLGKVAPVAPVNVPTPQPKATVAVSEKAPEAAAVAAEPPFPQVERKKWQPKAATTESTPPEAPPVKRKAWKPKAAAAKEEQPKPAEEKLPDH
jgi:hypothetical protein